jgi:hypothetical protein
MGWFGRRRKPEPAAPTEPQAPVEPPRPDRTYVVGQGSLRSDDPRATIRAYRDPMHPDRPVHPKKVARSLHGRPGFDNDPEVIAREAEIADVDPEAVRAELARLAERDENRRLHPEAGGAKVERIRESSLDCVDLTAIPGIATRIVGQFAWLADHERDRYHADTYLLVREPGNVYSADAIAVFGRGRKVGYVPEGRAKGLAPLLDSIAGDAFIVASGEARGARHQVVLPRVPALRAFAAGRAK